MIKGGGIKRPSGPAPARVPMIMSSGYLRARSSGMVILPMVAQVAADEPETAAKMVQPITLVCSRRPGMRVIHGARPRNMYSDRRVRTRVPANPMNNGRAGGVQLVGQPRSVGTMGAAQIGQGQGRGRECEAGVHS